ncbi:hypothetical protein [Azospirillum sp. B506]|uniref:hypothetical protein n=1 Tax=Azospirillum sp. B506 TaxID=137721 RepID=UPI0011DDB7F4|nr:hypothetical protein [Azospirillum sp. B506]
MANIERLKAQFKNRVYQTLGEAGQMDVGDGCKATWNPCSNPKYPGPRYVYVSLEAPDGTHQTAIYDRDNGKFVS